MVPFVVFEFWLFGFVPLYFAHSVWFPPGVVYFVEILALTFPVHAVVVNNAGEGTAWLFQLTQAHATALVCGMAVGIALLYATDLPRLLDVRFYFDDPLRSEKLGGRVRVGGAADVEHGSPWLARAYGWTFFGLVLPFVALTAAVAFFANLYVQAGILTGAQSLLAGVIVSAFAAIFLIAYCWGTCAGRGDLPDSFEGSGLLNLKYFVLFVLVAHTPVYNDFLPGLGPWGRFAVMEVVAAIVYAVVVAAGRYDRLLGSERLERVVGVFALIFVIQTSVYAGSPLVLQGANTVEAALGYIGPVSVLWVVVLTFVGAVRRRRVALDRSERANASFLIDRVRLSEARARPQRAR